MGDVAPLVVPHEGVIAGGRIGDIRIALVGGHEVVGELHDMGMVEGQGNVADAGLALVHRGDPADQRLEALAHRVLLAAVSGLFRLKGDALLFRLLRGVGTNDRRRQIGADDPRDVDLAAPKFFQLREEILGLAPGVFLARDVDELPGEEVAAAGLDNLAAAYVDKGHLMVERQPAALPDRLRRAVMVVFFVIGGGGPDLGAAVALWLGRLPAAAVLADFPGAVKDHRLHFPLEKAAVKVFRGGKLGGKEDIAIAFVEKSGNAVGGVGGQPFNALPGFEVEGADGTLRGKIADLRHQLAGVAHHFLGLLLDRVAKQPDLLRRQ